MLEVRRKPVQAQAFGPGGDYHCVPLRGEYFGDVALDFFTDRTALIEPINEQQGTPRK